MLQTARPQTTKARNAKAQIVKKKPCHETSGHADHVKELPRLKRIQGQVMGIERMISEQRYCMDILVQIKAARSALQALEGEVLKSHLKGCVKDVLESRDSFSAEEKIKELLDLLAR